MSTKSFSEPKKLFSSVCKLRMFRSDAVILICFLKGRHNRRPAVRCHHAIMAHNMPLFTQHCYDIRRPDAQITFDTAFAHSHTQLMLVVTSAISFLGTCNGNKSPVLLASRVLLIWLLVKQFPLISCGKKFC